MKYSVEITTNGYVETLEVNGKEYRKHWKEKGYCTSCNDDDFSEQMEKDGYDEEILESVQNDIDGSFFASDVHGIYEKIAELN